MLQNIIFFLDKKKDLDTDPCSTKPCINGGNCSNDNGKIICTCPSNYTGNRCQYERGKVISLLLISLKNQ